MSLPSDSEALQAMIQRLHGKPVERSDQGYANKDHGAKVIDGEDVDYRYDEIAGTGPGGLKKPEGPSQI